MRRIFIPVVLKKKLDRKLFRKVLKILPENVALFYSIQYKSLAGQIKKELIKDNKNITKFAQVLGCLKPLIDEKTQAVLLVSDGEFHGLSLSYYLKKQVYVFNGESFIKIKEKTLENYKAKKKASYLKFLNAKKIGILISIKPGQERFERAPELKKLIKDKEIYLFIGDTFNSKDFENFSKIDIWVNTACPRLDMDNPKMINLSDVYDLIGVGK